MVTSLSNLANNLSEGIYKFRYKHGLFFEYASFKDDLIECKRFCCNKNYLQKFDQKLKERFFNTYKFSNHDNNEFIFFVAIRCLSL